MSIAIVTEFANSAPGLGPRADEHAKSGDTRQCDRDARHAPRERWMRVQNIRVNILKATKESMKLERWRAPRKARSGGSDVVQTVAGRDVGRVFMGNCRFTLDVFGVVNPSEFTQYTCA